MGLLIFMICFIFEIAFVIYSIVQHTKRSKWRMQRVMVSTGELVIYLLMLILPGVDFGFRFRMFFIVMVIRILIEEICLLAVRRKAAGAKIQDTTEMDTAKKPVGAIIGAISGILFIGFGLIPAFIFTGYDGLGSEERECIVLYCHEVNDLVREIVSFVKSRQGQLSGSMDGKLYEIPITDIYYVEAVDNKVFIYSLKRVYETKMKLYEMEEMLLHKHFLRVSKSVLLNLMKVTAIKPALNGRFTAILPNGEQIMISRKYVPELKKKIRGGNEE